MVSNTPAARPAAPARPDVSKSTPPASPPQPQSSRSAPAQSGQVPGRRDEFMAARPAASGSKPEELGGLSRKYESNGNPGMVSSGVGDHGGRSYGAYQFS